MTRQNKHLQARERKESPSATSRRDRSGIWALGGCRIGVSFCSPLFLLLHARRYSMCPRYLHMVAVTASCAPWRCHGCPSVPCAWPLPSCLHPRPQADPTRTPPPRSRYARGEGGREAQAWRAATRVGEHGQTTEAALLVGTCLFFAPRAASTTTIHGRLPSLSPMPTPPPSLPPLPLQGYSVTPAGRLTLGSFLIPRHAALLPLPLSLAHFREHFVASAPL